MIHKTLEYLHGLIEFCKLNINTQQSVKTHPKFGYSKFRLKFKNF